MMNSSIEMQSSTLSPRWEPPSFSVKPSRIHSPTGVVPKCGLVVNQAANKESNVTQDHSHSLDDIYKDIASIDSALDSEECIDSRGRCKRHPHNRLRKKALFGGWKVLMKACPDCCIEVFNTVGSSSCEKDKKTSIKKKRASLVAPPHRLFRKSLKRSVASTVCSSDGSSSHYSSASSNSSGTSQSDTKDTDCANKRVARTAPQIVENHLMYSCQMDYVDFDGNVGCYTGTINQDFVPHGRGVLVCNNGSRMKGIWSMGRLVLSSALRSMGAHPSENRSSSSACTNLTSKPIVTPLLHTVVFKELKNWNPRLLESQVVV